MGSYHRIQILAERYTITITQLQKELGIARNVIERWDKGTIPSLGLLIKIADYFDVSLDYLTERTDEPEVKLSYKKLPDEAMELIRRIKTMFPTKEQAQVIHEYLTALSEFDS